MSHVNSPENAATDGREIKPLPRGHFSLLTSKHIQKRGKV